jgi:hypothetical protein
MGLGQNSPLLMQTARLLHDGGSLAEPDGGTGEAKDAIGQAPLGEHLDALRGAQGLSPRTRRGVCGQWRRK